jgi:hypothetical protein
MTKIATPLAVTKQIAATCPHIPADHESAFGELRSWDPAVGNHFSIVRSAGATCKMHLAEARYRLPLYSPIRPASGRCSPSTNFGRGWEFTYEATSSAS